jgi:hypothetical protein
METKALLYDLRTAYGLDLHEDHRKKPASPGDLTVDELADLLADRINDMINRDFSTLVQLLYRIDVSESKLRQLLQGNTTTDAGRTIARLILERQWQKIETRRQYKVDKSSSDDLSHSKESGEERW